MIKYAKEILLTASEDNNFRTTRLSVSECSTPAEADKEIRKWLSDLPNLVKIRGNEKIIDTVLL